MRQIRPEKNQVARRERRQFVSDKLLRATAQHQRDLALRVMMPHAAKVRPAHDLTRHEFRGGKR